MQNVDRALALELANGETRHIGIGRCSAMEGLSLQSRYVEFVSTHSKDIRRNYVMEVLAYAFVMLGDTHMPIATSAIVSNHLQSPEAINAVFRAVLAHNGIDPDAHVERRGFWDSVGQEVAIAFMTEASVLIKPILSEAMGDAA